MKKTNSGRIISKEKTFLEGIIEKEKTASENIDELKEELKETKMLVTTKIKNIPIQKDKYDEEEKEAEEEEEEEEKDEEAVGYSSISRSIQSEKSKSSLSSSIRNEPYSEIYSESYSEPLTDYTSKIDIIFPKEEIINEGYTTDKSMKRINKFITYVSNSICKLNINDEDNEGIGMGTGFLIKIKNNINNKTNYKYFLITCEHVIKREYIESENTEIEINYHSRAIKLKINLDKYERMIRTYEDIIDITLIEILKEDDINENYFLF